MKRRTFVVHAACAAALALAVPPALGQTVLKFSHTDQPGAARQAAALIFAKSVENYSSPPTRRRSSSSSSAASTSPSPAPAPTPRISRR